MSHQTTSPPDALREALELALTMIPHNPCRKVMNVSK